MMKKFITIGAVLVLSLSMLAGCGNSDADANVNGTETKTENEVVVEQSSETTVEESTEEVVENSEAIPETEEIIENDEVVTEEETTETVPENDEVVEEPVAPKTEYTYTELSATMWAKSSVNVRDLPSTDGERVGGLSARQQVTVTGTCNETGWYRIAYNNGTGYVSNSYIVAERPAEPEPEQPSQPSGNYDGYDEFGNGYVWGDDGYKHFDASCPYPINQIVDNYTQVYYYGIYGQPQKAEEAKKILAERFGVIINNNHLEHYKVGYYKEGLVIYMGWTYNP